ncbi:MAG: cupin domain-containing protein [bacterium]
MQKINLVEKFNLFDDYWRPKIVGEVNDFHVKLAKLKGEFVWHHHESEDELFLVVKGKLLIQMRQGEVELHPGEFFIVPKGVEHRPVAEEEAQVLLFEPKSTLNTGHAESEFTVKDLDKI